MGRSRLNSEFSTSLALLGAQPAKERTEKGRQTRRVNAENCLQQEQDEPYDLYHLWDLLVSIARTLRQHTLERAKCYGNVPGPVKDAE